MATDTGTGLQPSAVATRDSAVFRFSQSLLLLLAICFLLQVFSPLRLNNDAITLLSMGESAAHGGGFLDSGKETVFPRGYPALLAVLLTAGLAHPWVIVGLNMVFLLVGLIGAYSLLIREFFEERAVVLMICSFFLLSYVVIKHCTIPLTDIPFFCCSMCCLAVIGRTKNMDLSWRLVTLTSIAWLLAITAIAVRTAGIALFPPLVFMFAKGSGLKLLLERLSLRAKLIVLTVAALAGAVITYFISQTAYIQQLKDAVRASALPALALGILRYRVNELGELFGNFPLIKMPAELRVVVPWLGFVLLFLMLTGLATKLRKISPTEMFMVCYLGVLFVWPFNDARFWLPVIPLIFAYSLLAVRRLRIPKTAIATYCVVFAMLGFGVIGYSTRITFSDGKFPYEYGDGSLKPTYCAAFQSCRDGNDSDKVDAKALRLLREYR